MMGGRDRWIKSVPAFAIGLGVGAAVGILLAPRSGRDTRDLVVESAKDNLEGAIAAGQQLKQRAQDSIDELKGQVKRATDVGEQAYREAKSSAS
jgi:gas vesicle protein